MVGEAVPEEVEFNIFFVWEIDRKGFAVGYSDHYEFDELDVGDTPWHKEGRRANSLLEILEYCFQVRYLTRSKSMV